MSSNLTVHITKDGRQYILVPKVNGDGKKKSYGYFGEPGIDFFDYVRDDAEVIKIYHMGKGYFDIPLIKL